MKRALTLIATILITMSLAAQERVQVKDIPYKNAQDEYVQQK